MADEVKALSSFMKGVFLEEGDNRVLRAELMLEELSEVLKGLGARDELAALDGLADLMYVTVGTATSYSLPVLAAFNEVHASNMTKTPKLNHAAGLTGKGPGFKPPDLLGLLQCHPADCDSECPGPKR
jgi:hypothetical protein